MAKNISILSPEYSMASEVSFPHESRDLMKSPNSMWQEDSEGRQDSGYCSLTPISSLTPIFSVSRPNIFNQKCNLCFKTITKSYAQSTPHYDTCSCKKHNSFDAMSPNEEFLETISEPKSIYENKFSSGRKQNIPLVLDEAMDSSLYTDEMEVEESGEGTDCNFESLEISDERSIDFLDNGSSLFSSTSKSKDFSKQVNVTDEFNSDVTKKLFTPESFMSTSEIESPKYQNETTPTKCGRPTFVNAASKVGLMKRIVDLWTFKLSGIEEVDFLYQLAVKRSFPHITSKIFSFLSDKDIDSVRKVSKTWKDIVTKDKTTYNRWKNYKRVMKLKQENYFSPRKASRPGPEDTDELSLPMKNITNQNMSPGKSANCTSPVSGESLRFHCNQKAVRKLKAGDRLLPCPKCCFPAHDHGSPTVECSRSGCRFRFCVWCRTRSSPSFKHKCLVLAPRSPTGSGSRTGSKACKRRLRRLSQLS